MRQDFTLGKDSLLDDDDDVGDDDDDDVGDDDADDF